MQSDLFIYIMVVDRYDLISANHSTGVHMH